MSLPFNIVGRAQEGPFAGDELWAVSSGNYFDVFEIPVLRGRTFDERDDGAGEPVVVINEAFAKRYWPDGADPLQQSLSIGGAQFMPALAGEPARRIIGVVGDVRSFSMATDPLPAMYVPQAQIPDAFNTFLLEGRPLAWVVRTRGEPLALAAAVQEALWQVTGAPVTGVQTMASTITLPAVQLALRGRTVRSCQSGNTWMSRDIPLFARMIEQGHVDPAPLISRTYALDEINDAALASEQRRDLTGVVLPNA